jgi:hypothetical protein
VPNVLSRFASSTLALDHTVGSIGLGLLSLTGLSSTSELVSVLLSKLVPCDFEP